MIRLLLLVTLLSSLCNLQAQSFYSISGTVKDTTGEKIIAANIWLMSEKDTLHTISNEKGDFNFKNITPETFTIKVSILGYDTWQKLYSFKGANNEIILPNIILSTKTNQLREIIIKSSAIPISLKHDTIEYSVNRYHLRENSVVEDLLKRLPGLQVDMNGNISFMGKPISKIRINGEDFTIDNIKNLTRILPVEMLDKVQLVDDYGEMATLTGRKRGIPVKVINLQTASTLKKLNNLRVTTGIGTDKRYSSEATGFIYGSSGHVFINGNLNNLNPGPGNTDYKKGIITYRKKINNALSISTSIHDEHTDNQQSMSNAVTTLTSTGNLYNNNKSDITSNTQLYNFIGNVDYKPSNGDIYGINIKGSINKTTQTSNQTATQTGIQHLDQYIINSGENSFPSISGNIQTVHHFKNSGELMSLSLNIDHNNSNSTEYISNNSKYYNTSDSLSKDSSLLQLIKKENNANIINFQSSYIKPLSENSDLELHYSYISNKNKYNLSTQWQDHEEKYQPNDSLSNQYIYSTYQHDLGLSFKKKSSALEYTLGITFEYNKYYNKQSFQFLPDFRINYSLSKSSNFSFYYSCNMTFPNYQQVQPTPDFTNPLYPIVGNPNIHSMLNSFFTLEYRHTGKNTIFLTLGVVPIFNKITNNIILVKDTFNIVRQETHFINTNGNYSINTNYGWSKSFVEGKFQIFLDGNSSYNKNIFYTDNIRKSSKNININQSLKGNIYNNWLELNSTISYSYNHNAYPGDETVTTALNTWNFQLNTKYFIGKSWTLEIYANKQLNSGYSGSISANPVILNAALEKSFFKKSLICRFYGSNIMNETKNISPYITANTVTETRSNQIGRYYMLSLALNLKKIKK